MVSEIKHQRIHPSFRPHQRSPSQCRLHSIGVLVGDDWHLFVEKVVKSPSDYCSSSHVLMFDESFVHSYCKNPNRYSRLKTGYRRQVPVTVHFHADLELYDAGDETIFWLRYRVFFHHSKPQSLRELPN